MSAPNDVYRRNPARDVEAFAVRVVRAWAEQIGKVTDLSAGHEPDFRIDYFDARVARGEVTWHADPAVQAMWSNTFKRDWHEVVELSPGLGQWTVGLRRGANINLLYKELERLIVDLTAHGQTSIEIWHTWPRGPVSDHARRLGIEYVHRVTTGPDRAVYFMPHVAGTVSDDPNVIVDWIESVIDTPAYADVTDKLLSFDVDERHIFLMSGSATPISPSFRLQQVGSSVPTRSPQLPEGITHVWAASQFGEDPVALWSKEGWSLVPLPSSADAA